MLKKFNVEVLRFDPNQGPHDPKAEKFTLPVDSPDEEHAISAAMSNAVAFTPKYEGGVLASVAFTCKGVSPRE